MVNLDPQVRQLQVMQEEIEALREELVKTRLSTKPPSATTIQTVDSSVMVEVGGGRVGVAEWVGPEWVGQSGWGQSGS